MSLKVTINRKRQDALNPPTVPGSASSIMKDQYVVESTARRLDNYLNTDLGAVGSGDRAILDMTKSLMYTIQGAVQRGLVPPEKLRNFLYLVRQYMVGIDLFKDDLENEHQLYVKRHLLTLYHAYAAFSFTEKDTEPKSVLAMLPTITNMPGGAPQQSFVPEQIPTPAAPAQTRRDREQ